MNDFFFKSFLLLLKKAIVTNYFFLNYIQDIMVYRKKTSRKGYAKKTQVFGKMNNSKLIAKKRRNNLVKLVKDIQISESEMKYKSGTYSVQTLNHNTVTEAHLWAFPGSSYALTDIFPGQGTSDGNRIGDRIYCKGILVRGMFQITGDRRNTSVAVYFVPHNSEQGSPGDYNQLFHNVTGSSMMDTLQKKRFPKAQFLGRFRVKPSDLYFYPGIAANHTAQSASIYFKKWIPIEKKLYFKADATTNISNLEEYGTLVIAPYQNVNTLSTDTLVVNCDLHATTYYKDL